MKARVSLKRLLIEEFDLEKPTEDGVREAVIQYLDKYKFGEDRYDFDELIKAAFLSQEVSLFELILLLSLRSIDDALDYIRTRV